MDLLFYLLRFWLCAVALTVLLSYAVAWYELANQQPTLIDRRFKSGNLWLAVKLLACETLAVFLTSLLYPLGWLFPTERSARHDDGPVVLLLHGLFHSRCCWWLVKWRLRRHGFRNLHSINLPAWRDSQVLTELIAKKVDLLRHATGVDKVVLIGHSMGGLLGRNYLQLRGGELKVARLVQLGSPNGGSKLAPFALSRLARQLLPGSAFLGELKVAALPSGVPVTSIYSRHDNIIIPPRLSQLEGAENIELVGIGHVTLLYARRSFEALLEALRKDSS